MRGYDRGMRFEPYHQTYLEQALASNYEIKKCRGIEKKRQKLRRIGLVEEESSRAKEESSYDKEGSVRAIFFSMPVQTR